MFGPAPLANRRPVTDAPGKLAKPRTPAPLGEPLWPFPAQRYDADVVTGLALNYREFSAPSLRRHAETSGIHRRHQLSSRSRGTAAARLRGLPAEKWRRRLRARARLQRVQRGEHQAQDVQVARRAAAAPARDYSPRAVFGDREDVLADEYVLRGGLPRHVFQAFTRRRLPRLSTQTATHFFRRIRSRASWNGGKDGWRRVRAESSRHPPRHIATPARRRFPHR